MYRKTMFRFAILLMSTSSLYGATITAVSQKKRAVRIDAGAQMGFSEGKILCFFVRGDDAPVLCGPISQSAPNHAFVEVSETDILKLQKGMIAQLKGDKKDHEEDPQAETSALGHSTKASLFSLTAAYQPFLLLPFSVTVPNYAAPPSGSQQATSLWTADHTLTSAYAMTLALEGTYNPFHLLMGARYLQLGANPVQTDYTASDLTLYAERSFSDSAMGFYGDYLWMQGPRLSLGTGLDITQNSVTSTTVEHNNAGTLNKTLFTVKSTLTVVSLHIPVRFQQPLFSKIAINLGADLLVPLFSMESHTVSQSDSLNGGKVSDPSTDAFNALAHKKSAVGLDLIIGVSYVH